MKEGMTQFQTRYHGVLLFGLIFLFLSGCGGERAVEIVGDVAERNQLVIVSLGDSYASGEGNPDVTLQAGGPSWFLNSSTDATLCRRSLTNGHRLAAVEIASEWEYGENNVVFESFACSGATINGGLLGPQFSGESTCASDGSDPINCHLSQLVQAQNWRNDPDNGILDIDIVIISIGGNDIGFGGLIRACATPAIAGGIYSNSCDQNPSAGEMLVNGCTSTSKPPICPVEGYDFMNPHIVGLEGLPSALDELFAEVHVRLNPDHILLVGFPDPIRDANGNFCDRWSEGFKVGLGGNEELQPGGTTVFGVLFPVGAATEEVEASESAWAYDSILIPLNNILRNKADANDDVTYVDGMVEETKGHGICAESDRWFLTFKDSYEVQGNVFGTMHPNQFGHQAYARLIADKLREVLDISDES